MLFPNQINTYIADQDLPWEYTWVEFDGLRAKEIVSTAGLSPDHPVYHAGSKDLRNEMMNEMLYIARHPGSSSESSISYDRRRTGGHHLGRRTFHWYFLVNNNYRSIVLQHDLMIIPDQKQRFVLPPAQVFGGNVRYPIQIIKHIIAIADTFPYCFLHSTLRIRFCCIAP